MATEQAGAYRMAAVLVTPDTGASPPPGVPAARFWAALVEDTCEIVSSLELLTPAVAVWGGSAASEAELSVSVSAARELTWPGTAVLGVQGAEADLYRRVFGELAEQGAQFAALICADAPDLPPLLVGKLFRALGRADIAACPAQDGGLVALAARLPVPDWLPGIHPDDAGALARLAQARPSRRALAVTPGWHRQRRPADIANLDPGLEGWDATRMLLADRH